MSERLFSEKHNRSQVEEISEEAKKLEQMQQLKTDIKLEVDKKPPTRMQRKMKRIFGASGNSANAFKTGFIMGAGVGAVFGAVGGAVQAYNFRSFSIIPLTMIVSGGSFGCFMGMGMMIRQGDQ